MLHTLSEFSCKGMEALSAQVTDWYGGQCPVTGAWLQLPRTALVEAIAHHLMHQLDQDGQAVREGKMYGVLLVDAEGEWRVLKAFSGLLNGESVVQGWVPPIPGREQVALQEAQTLAALDQIKQELIALEQLPERQQYADLLQDGQQRLQALTRQHQQRKAQRQQQRQHLLETLSGTAQQVALATLDQESQRDGSERRQLKRQQAIALQPLQQQVEQANQRIQELKQQRKLLSQELQAQMHAAYRLTNFAGQSLPLQQLMPAGMPTGTGDCCAPKLLHYAAAQGLTPLAMAEFWWGPAQGDKVPGEFYGACAERCQPLMGFLLSGLLAPADLPILYEDEVLIAVDKPAGVLSVPGRYYHTQDSILSRLRQQLPPDAPPLPVHRLDQDTSGILLLARNPDTHRQLSQQFEGRKVRKVYEAVIAGVVIIERGMIDLPLWGNPDQRPYQTVDWVRGKPSLTQYRVLSRTAERTRLEFVPITGRTHQLRVHARAGLGYAIVGDRLYGRANQSTRLHLHARQLCFDHPLTGQPVCLESNPPF